jgi:DNA-binding LacI/PurR family transcriptional regulator/DNA-binding transcriptional regulator YhcF (GntR family)
VNLTDAKTFVNQIILRSQTEGKERLPSLRAMLAMAPVSHATLWKAIRELHAEGALDVRKNSGMYLKGASSQGSKPLLMGKRESIARRIYQDMVAGAFGSEPVLPAPKELAGRYGTGYPTTLRALEALEVKGIVARQGRAYHSALRRRNVGGTIALIARGGDSGVPLDAISWRRQAIHTLEEECARCAVRLQIILSDYEGNLSCEEKAISTRTLTRQKHLLGVLMWPLAIRNQRISELHAALGAGGLPVAVLIELMVELPTVPHVNNPRLFTLGLSPRPAQEVARYLLGLGHRRIAFVSACHGEDWSQTRLSSIQEVYTEAGLSRGVIAATSGTAAFQRLIRISLDRTRTGIRLLDVSRGRGTPLSDMRAFVDASGPAFVARTALGKVMNHEVGLLMRQQTPPTAIVGVNDGTAIAVREALRKAGIRVPHDVSLIGFDDSPEASATGLTSYNFNIDATVREMVRSVLNRSYQRPFQGTEVPGFIVERTSTRAL